MAYQVGNVHFVETKMNFYLYFHRSFQRKWVIERMTSLVITCKSCATKRKSFKKNHKVWLFTKKIFAYNSRTNLRNSVLFYSRLVEVKENYWIISHMIESKSGIMRNLKIMYFFDINLSKYEFYIWVRNMNLWTSQCHSITRSK